MDRQFVRSVSFNLTRRFSIVSFVVLVAVAGVLGQALARVVADRLLHRDAVVTMEFGWRSSGPTWCCSVSTCPDFCTRQPSSPEPKPSRRP